MCAMAGDQVIVNAIIENREGTLSDKTTSTTEAATTNKILVKFLAPLRGWSFVRTR